MKIAVMQPYFFPYIGYFDLIRQADVFVLFNDVQYIRRGWVNRNRIKSHQRDFQYLTVPVKKAPQTTLISNIEINYSTNWKTTQLKTLHHIYGKTPRRILDVFADLPNPTRLQPLLATALKSTCEIMNINTTFMNSEDIGLLASEETGSTKRIIQICKALGATEYLNLPGGKNLYDPAIFHRNGLELRFLESCHPNKLSIIDYLITEGL